MSWPAQAGLSLIPDGLLGTLVLVRHGQSTFVAAGRFQGRLDVPLSPLGERQAALTGDWLAPAGARPGQSLVRGRPLEVTFSPLARAASSAAIIAAALKPSGDRDPALTLRPDEGLMEIGQGDWEGRTMADVAAGWGDLLAAWRRSPMEASAPGGEALVDADRRVRATLRGILARLGADMPRRPEVTEAARWTLVVAHDGVLRLMLLALLDLPLDRFWAFPFSLCGVTVVEVGDGRATLRAHNLAGHLDAPDDDTVSDRTATPGGLGPL